jgi:hypothetical protein
MGDDGAGTPAGGRTEATAFAQRLERWGREREWRGSDPYDGLNSSRRALGRLKQRPLGKRVLTQTVKRSPLDLRPLLGIPPGASAASLAWVVSAYARGGFLEREAADARLREALQLLGSLRCRTYEEPCWGYHFDVQSRVFFYSSQTPNTIATAFAGHALLDAHAALGEPELLAEACLVGEFFLRHVPQVPDEPGAYFGYLPGDRSPIHNSSLLVASLLARLAAASGDDGFAAPAAAAVRYATARQRPDGSWPYGERPNLDWVDNFHSGYVLDALRACADAGVAATEAEVAWRRGLAHYRRHFFLADGTPKYYPDNVYPIDAQSIAQGIQTLSIAARFEPQTEEMAWKVFGFAMRRMRRRDGLPIFQRRRLWSNQAVHVRWVVAPTLLALSHLLTATERRPEQLQQLHRQVAER